MPRRSASTWSSSHLPVRLSDQVTLFGDSAFRRFRYEHGVYDLIYQRCRSAPCLTRFAEYSEEWFVLLAAHIGAAIFHHAIRKDGTLMRML